MRRFYLSMLSLAFTAGALAQTPVGAEKATAGAVPMVANPKAFVEPNTSNLLSSGKAGTVQLQRRGNLNYSFIKVGSTFYDLQSNSAMPHRIHVDQAGNINLVWTTSPNDQNNFPARGTGFNFKPASGSWATPSSTRIESVRTGWPNVGMLRNGSIFIIGHDATNGGFTISKNNTAGSTTFTAANILTEFPFKPIWGRVANSGDTIHFICSYTDSAAVGESRAPTRKGIFSPMVYSRSRDGGANWDIQHIMLPDYDSTRYINGGSDQYAIDVRGDVVAIINGDLLQDVVIWKSLDAGTTWTRIIADSFKYSPYKSKTLMPDTPFCSDGSVDVIIDENNNIHAFWGLGRVIDQDTTDEFYSFFPGLQGIVHWSEIDKTQRVIAAGGAFDRDGDGFNNISRSTFSSLEQGSIPSGLSTVARLTNTSAMRQPNAGIDANGRLYCIFSVPIELDLIDLDANYRDIGIVFSEDQGSTWSTPQNLTQSFNKEDDFACIARNVNGFVHMMWQQDDIPGTNLQNNVTTIGNHPALENTILYAAIPTSEILNGNIGMQWGVNVEQPNTGVVSVVTQNYPNPFNDKTNVLVYLNQPGDLTISVHDLNGKLVKSFAMGQLVKGNHIVEIDANGLTNGVYTYTITSGNSSVTKTMMVQQ